MVDFSNLTRLDVTDETTVEYVFSLVPGQPSVWLAPATDQNKLYLNERLKIATQRAEKLAAEAKGRGGRSRKKAKVQITADDFEEDREVDRVLLARTCCKRWGVAPKDVKGDQPEFNEENCYAFLKALPDYMLDPFRNFAGNVYNFMPSLGDDFLPITDEEKEALGNS